MEVKLDGRKISVKDKDGHHREPLMVWGIQTLSLVYEHTDGHVGRGRPHTRETAEAVLQKAAAVALEKWNDAEDSLVGDPLGQQGKFVRMITAEAHELLNGGGT